MSNARLSDENITKLLAGGEVDVEIEAAEPTGFSFLKFFSDNSDVKMTFNNGFTILRNRAAIYTAVKTGKYKFQGKPIIAPSSTVTAGHTDWTFRRLEGYIRGKMFILLTKAKSEEKQAMYNKLTELPMVSAYGLKPAEKYDIDTARIMLTLGGPLPLMASLEKFAAVAFPIAYFQNVKKEALGINKFSTYEQLCKVARVMSSRGFTFDKVHKEIFDKTLEILKNCTPGTAGAASLNKFKEELQALEGMFGKIVIDNDAGSSKPSPPKKNLFG
ncbi:nucleocapsid protein [Alstroemeria yellow spot virus]|uniref:Nucleoprotein n=1 Tax=Alstroemeria yellow spot virus TaxID=2212644 RepID=A0A344AIH3_9VIRU|nr:nucleocapsid protein [Alstroemeria yellow spot virus]AWV56664.1 nucleocapsid protein [Alstroemeria yellow spot virus]